MELPPRFTEIRLVVVLNVVTGTALMLLSLRSRFWRLGTVRRVSGSTVTMALPLTTRVVREPSAPVMHPEPRLTTLLPVRMRVAGAWSVRPERSILTTGPVMPTRVQFTAAPATPQPRFRGVHPAAAEHSTGVAAYRVKGGSA